MTTKNFKKGLTGEQVLEKEGRNGLNNSPNFSWFNFNWYLCNTFNSCRGKEESWNC